MRASTTAFLTGILSGTNKKKRLDEADAERNRQLDLAASAQAQREQAQKANEALSLLSFLGKTGASGQGMADTVAGQLGLQSPGDASGLVTYNDVESKRIDASKENAQQSDKLANLRALEAYARQQGLVGQQFQNQKNLIDYRHKYDKTAGGTNGHNPFPSKLTDFVTKTSGAIAKLTDPDMRTEAAKSAANQFRQLATLYGFNIPQGYANKLFGVHDNPAGLTAADQARRVYPGHGQDMQEYLTGKPSNNSFDAWVNGTK